MSEMIKTIKAKRERVEKLALMCPRLQFANGKLVPISDQSQSTEFGKEGWGKDWDKGWNNYGK